MWRAVSTHRCGVREPREGLLLCHLNLLAFDISPVLAFGLQKEDGGGWVAFADELVEVTLCEVEGAVVDVLDGLLVLGVFLQPVVVGGSVYPNGIASRRHDPERAFEGFEHLLFFAVGFVGSYCFHLGRIRAQGWNRTPLLDWEPSVLPVTLPARFAFSLAKRPFSLYTSPLRVHLFC